ncbi:MAG: hypothetical protein ACAH17_03250 [Candidatus Paceibacterota bacterium]
MHNTQTIHSHLLRFILIGFGFLSLLLVATLTPASAATTCSLSFSGVADTTQVRVGQTITRTFTVKNIGSSICKNVSYSLYYSPDETFVSSTPVPRASNYYWSIGTLASGKQISTKVITKVNSTTEPEVTTEGCATGTGAQDACTASTVALQAGTVVTPPVSVITQPTPVVTPTPVATTTPVVVPSSSKELGIWIWNFPSQMLSATADAQLKQLQANGFNAVYITIDDYLDIASMPEGTAKESAKATYFSNLSKFIVKAKALGIAVDAEGGWRDWAKSANRWKGYALIDAAKQYNALYPNAKLRGFQYDVEPYILPEYETNKATVLTDFVTYIDLSAQRLVGSDLAFSISIPHFYDDAQAWTPAITYAGKTMHTFNHLLAVMEKKPGSTILLMSYRDTFEGTNGTRQISETEIKEASAGYSTNVIVSQETGNVDPDFVTYYGGTKAEVMNAVATIQSAFSSYSRFGGVAVHYMDSFLEMR